ncbi:MAG: hypothetical protein ACP5KN_12235 [Armatimonadota bacterium]
MYRYALFHYVKNVMRDDKEPVGLVVWSPRHGEHVLRFPGGAERVREIGGQESNAIVSAVRDQLRGWIADQRLPMYPELSDPSSDEWWAAVADLLHHSVEMGPTHPMQLRDEAQAETERLFRNLVHTEQIRESIDRIDSKITAALRRCGLHEQFEVSPELPGSHGTPVKVRRAYCRGQSAVVVDGANLRVSDPFRQVDELVGKLDRLRANGLKTLAAIGVLNGHDTASYAEALRSYLSDSVHERQGQERSVFDLDTEADEFASAVERYKNAVDRSQGDQQRALIEG